MSPTAVVTGASRGLGRASALEFARRGWRVVAAMRSPQQDGPMLQVAAGTNADRIQLQALDLMDAHSIEAAADELSVIPVDALIHVAGIAPVASFEDTLREDWERTFQTNLFGPMQLTASMLPGMRERGSGRIVAVGSIAARIGLPLSSVYGASKAGLERWIESLAVELHPFGLSAHVLEAGMFDTELVETGKLPQRPGPYRHIYEHIEPQRARVLALAKPAARFAVALADLVESKRPPVLKPVGTDAIVAHVAQRLVPNRIISGMLHRAFR